MRLRALSYGNLARRAINGWQRTRDKGVPVFCQWSDGSVEIPAH